MAYIPTRYPSIDYIATKPSQYLGFVCIDVLLARMSNSKGTNG